MEEIKFVGLKELSEDDQSKVQKLCTEYYGKIRRMLKNQVSITVQFKQYDKEGNRTKYSINIKASAPTRIFTSNKEADWDVSKALHKAFEDLETQIEHTFHTDYQKSRK